MSRWDEHDLGTKVLAILQDVRDSENREHLGRPFLTAYQIAIEFERRFPDTFRAIGLPVGGAGTGQHNSLSQLLAREISQHVKRGELAAVETGQLAPQDVEEFSFKHPEGPVRSSLHEVGFCLSMFRVRG